MSDNDPEYKEAMEGETPKSIDDLINFNCDEDCIKCGASFSSSHIAYVHSELIPSKPEILANHIDEGEIMCYNTVEFEYIKRICGRCGYKTNCHTADYEDYDD